MSIPSSELLNPERWQAELNQQRKLRLFYRFGSAADRNKALKLIESSRSFSDELGRVDHFGPDTSSDHSVDGLVLRLDQYNAAALGKIEAFLTAGGCPVVSKNEWIIEPEEQEKEAATRQQEQLQVGQPGKVTEIKPRPEPELAKSEEWEQDIAA